MRCLSIAAVWKHLMLRRRMDAIIAKAEEPAPGSAPLSFQTQFARSWTQQYLTCCWCAPCTAWLEICDACRR